MDRIDALIFGGGPAGCGIALALANLGFSRLLILHHPPPADRPRMGESAAPDVAPLLERLGLESDLGLLGHQPCFGDRAIWGGPEPIERDFFAQAVGNGWRLDRAAFDAWLLAQAQARGARVWEGARLMGLARDGADPQTTWRVALAIPPREEPPDPGEGPPESSFTQDRPTASDPGDPTPGTVRNGPPPTAPESSTPDPDRLNSTSSTTSPAEQLAHLECRFLVDATGRGAALAQALGVRRRRLDRLIGLAGLLPLRPGTDVTHLSLVEAHTSGWHYAAGLPDGRGLALLLTDADLAKEGEWAQPVPFMALLAATTLAGHAFDFPDRPPRIFNFGAQSGFLERVAGPGWIAIGDSALSMDPLSAAGLNGALADAVTGGAAVGAFLRQGRDDGLRAHGTRINRALMRYLTERRERYLQEQRWPDAPFWRRRHGETTRPE